MHVVTFIDKQAERLIDTCNGFLIGKLNYTEINSLVWDILTEWQTLAIDDDSLINDKEQVFWHLLFELQIHDEARLMSDRLLRKQLYQCVLFLQRQQRMPTGCVGIRPNAMESKYPIASQAEEATA